MSDPIPEIDLDHHTAARLLVEIRRGGMPVPIWLRLRKERWKLTPENRDGICKGLLIALEMQEIKSP